MVSAGDFAYIPVIIFTSYFGGRVSLEKTFRKHVKWPQNT